MVMVKYDCWKREGEKMDDENEEGGALLQQSKVLKEERSSTD